MPLNTGLILRKCMKDPENAKKAVHFHKLKIPRSRHAAADDNYVFASMK